MKKLVLVTGLFMVLGFGGMALSQTGQGAAGAQGYVGGDMPNNYYDCPMIPKHMMRHGRMGMGKGMMGGPMGIKPGDPNFENYKKFRTEAAPIIEELQGKRAELRALYGSSNPDPKKAGKLAKEITELELKLEDLAFKHNLPSPCPMMGIGKGMMRGRRF